MRLLQLSDPHFGTEVEPVMHALLSLVRKVQPARILLSGDITQRARRGQFAAARRFVAQLPAPVIAVPGNHDIPLFNVLARWWAPYGNYCRAFGPQLEPEYDSDEVLVVGVNSTRASRHKDGEISPAQVERVAARLARASARQLRVVMLHHPVRAWEGKDDENIVHGGDAAIAAWVSAGADLVLGGHIHLPYVLPLGDGKRRRAWTVQAGTALSHRVRGDVPNSVNVIHYARVGSVAECAVERWDYQGRSGFVRVERLALELSR